MQTKGSIKGKLLLLFVAVAWGSSMVVIKGSTDFLPAGGLLALRFTLASIFLAIMYRKKLKLIDKEYIKAGIFIGVCLFLAYFTQTIGVMLEMPGKSHFLSSAYCVFVPFIGWLVLRQKPKMYHIIAATMCAIGIIFVSVVGSFSISYGDSISIISSVFWAAQIVAIAKWGEGKDPGIITFLQFVVSGILAWIYTLVFEDMSLGSLQGPAAFGVIYLGLVCSGLCFLSQTIAQKTESPTSVSIILSFENLFGIIFGMVFFAETMTVNKAIGFALMFAAILIAELQPSFLMSKADREALEMEKQKAAQ
ncbi:MAG: DMT family transporter [Lachnospiraceae bacterium]|nr:DMT family transporter [Lachnospiraceae bacterium]